MNLLDWLKQRWTASPPRQIAIPIDSSHVDGPRPEDGPLIAGEHYFRIRLIAMSVKDDREWFEAWQPAVYSAVRFLFGDRDETIPHIAGTALLKGLDRATINRTVTVDYDLTALLPYNGGDVEIETGLLAVRAQSDSQALLGVLGRFSRLLVVPPLSSVLGIIDSIAAGISELFGATDVRPVLRFHQTFKSDGSSGAALKAGYYLVSSDVDREITSQQVWVKEGRALYGETLAKAQPLSGQHHLLYLIESSRALEHWDAMTTIQEPYRRAVDALQQAAYEADPDLQQQLTVTAAREFDQARLAALRAKELTAIGGRNQVMQGLTVAYQRAKESVGLGLADNEAPRDLRQVVSQGWSVGEALAVGNLPEWVWFSGQPIGMAAPPDHAAGESGLEGFTAEPPGLDRGIEPSSGGEFETVAGAGAGSESETAGHASDAEPIAVTRTPHIDVVSNRPLRPGDTFKVNVYADQGPARAGEETRDINIVVPATTTRIDLEVWIEGSSHFTFPDTRVKPYAIDLRQPDGLPPATFVVQVRSDVEEPGGAFLRANFHYQGRASGHVRVKVELQIAQAAGVAAARVSGAGESESVESKSSASRPDTVRVEATASPPDLTIEVTDPENTQQRLQCLLRTPHLPADEVREPFAWNLKQQTGALVQALMAEFVKPNVSKGDRLLSLKGAGSQLWEVAPKRLKEVFWKLVDQNTLKTILIVSEEPFIPWELMVPKRPGEIRRPLGIEFLVGRWIPIDGVAPVQDLVLTNSLVIAPNYPPNQTPKPLKHAASEARLVLKAVDGTEVVPATLTAIRKNLEGGAAKLLHFVCHGADSSTIGIQTIYLEGGQWTSLMAAGMDDLVTAFRNRPLVFLNACEIGRLSSALVGVGGFAKAFIDAGASAVIAPLWSVRDSIAHQVAEDFYKALLEKGSVQPAEVFRQVRLKAYDQTDPETAGEDTYAAYCFYGDPCTLVACPPKGVPQ